MRVILNKSLDEFMERVSKIEAKPCENGFDFPMDLSVCKLNACAIRLILFLCEKYSYQYHKNKAFLLISVQDCVKHSTVSKQSFARAFSELERTGKIISVKKSSNRIAGNLLIFIPKYHEPEDVEVIKNLLQKTKISSDADLIWLYENTWRS